MIVIRKWTKEEEEMGEVVGVRRRVKLKGGGDGDKEKVRNITVNKEDVNFFTLVPSY